MKKVNVFNNKNNTRHTETNLVYAGRNPEEQFGFVNTPIYRGSTVLFKSLAAMQNRESRYTYATHGSPSADDITEALCYLDGAFKATLQPSGLASATLAITACVGNNGHILMVDSVYEPIRKFCDNIMTKMGIEVEYYDPLIADKIGELIRDNTQVIFTETPGSYSFELQDIPAISKVTKSINPDIAIITDNTWSASVFYKPLQLGADIVVSALTKYVCGHADVLMGAICTNEQFYPKIKKVQKHFGICTSPADSYLAARGMRTLIQRLRVHESSALKMALWLEEHPFIDKVLHPALASFEQHSIFKRDFSGSSGLLGFVCKKKLSHEAIADMCDKFELFGMGYSWGSYASLIVPVDMQAIRTITAAKWADKGTVFRLHVGMENTDDLIDELKKGLERAQKYSG